MDVIIQGKQTKCQIINKILEYVPTYSKSKLWSRCNDDLIKIDDRIAEFNMHKNEVFIDFFKYDFGNAIKGIDKKY